MEKKEAIKILKDFHDKSALFSVRTALETLYPELKESEDERIRKALLEMVHDTTGDELWVDYNVHKEEALAWLEKQGEQKPIIEMKSAEESLGINSETYSKIMDECIYGEQKPAWSAEDERKIQDCIDAVSHVNLFKVYYQNELVGWLKSLKDRYTWKPSDEQIGVVESLINNRPCKRKHVDSLYNDLKKLREDKS